MVGWALGGLATVYAVSGLWSFLRGDLSGSGYPDPARADRELDDALHTFAEAGTGSARIETIGESSEGRPIRAIWLRGRRSDASVPRLLVTANLHAIEFIGSFVARALIRRAVDRYGADPEVTALLDAADLCVVPLLNPDGAHRIWRAGGWTTLGGSRFTANGVDPNRNFPRPSDEHGSLWNSGRSGRGSAYYRGPAPLSEPECASLTALCRRERFCGAINFHSFGGVVYMPAVDDPAGQRVFSTFAGAFQSRQRRLRYRAVPEPLEGIAGQLDAFLLQAFGTPSVTVEVSRPGPVALRPGRLGNPFWIANPAKPDDWADNDADAALFALSELLERTGGRPLTPLAPELAELPSP